MNPGSVSTPYFRQYDPKPILAYFLKPSSAPGGFAADEWLNGNVRIPFAFSAMRQIEPLRRSDGLIIAVLLHTVCAVAGELTMAATDLRTRELLERTEAIDNTLIHRRDNSHP
ncbi:MAG: hypothetical protein JO007_07965 [Alphaproteobacteria bacterium]|nr:hypothetical protein [Alphaproteobacteria bacterium]